MKVTRVEADVLKVPFDQDYWGREAWKKDYEAVPRRGGHMDTTYPLRWRMRHRWSPEISTVLIRVHTDEGIVGLGESKGVIAPHAVKEYIDTYLASWLIGEDPFSVHVMWDRYRAAMRGRGHMQGFHQEAAAGLDIACWDIIGKASGRSISEVIGGRYRPEITVYYSGVAGVRDPSSDSDRERLYKASQKAVEMGHTAIKIATGFGSEADLASVDIVRDVLGDDGVVLVDALGGYDYTQALALGSKLADRGVFWFETPLPTDDFAGYVELTKRSPIPIANDLVWTIAMVRDMFAAGGRLIVIPESIKAGITESLQIAQLADQFGCGFAPHCSVGSAIQFAANLHISAAVPNFVIGELWGDENLLTAGLVSPNLNVENGMLKVLDGPGLGLTLNEDVLEQVVDRR
ncbi:MAG: mandelate racemase/muconate lactonizing enzyme family protein [Devosia sp.]|nr:mandelate racemase/muconate lactonizing enzyme family protein [Devosia sp.]